MWQQWINLILGLWVLAVPFIGITASTLTWTLAVTGIIIAGLALWGALVEQDPEYHRHSLDLRSQH
ncbi:MAG TPA: hypothetical protein VN701_00675 [Candidatus Paceibacterota bacterium]|nr:hypothetical protein [Candidatus Paceibacterota bacterium]